MRWLRRLILTLLLLVAGVYFAGPWMATPYLRSRLQATVSSRLNARLEIGRLRYVFPYQLIVQNAVLVGEASAGENVKLLSIPHMKMELAQHPFRGGPLVFRKLELKEPAIHLLRMDGGFVGQRDLVRGEPMGSNGSVRTKLSDLLELRRIEVSGGRIVYEDRMTLSAPMVWKGIDAHLSTDAAADPVYAVRFSASSAATAQLSIAADLNIDELVLDVRQLEMELISDPDGAESPVPAELQAFLRQHQIRGVMRVSGGGSVSLRPERRASFDLDLHLQDATARLPQSERAVEALSGHVKFSSRPLVPTQDLLLTAAAIRTATSSTAQPVSDESRFPGFFVLVRDAKARAGDTMVSVKQLGAAVDLSRAVWKVHDLDARLVVGAERGALPKPLRIAAEGAQLAGTIAITGSGGGNLRSDASGPRDYRIDLRAQSPKVLVTERRLSLTKVQCDLIFRPHLIELFEEVQSQRQGLHASAYGGQIKANGLLRLQPALHYRFDVTARNVDLGQLSAAWPKPGEKPTRIQGRASVDSRLRNGTGRGVVADGEFEVLEGDFYELPVIARIADSAAPSREAGTVGQAAGLFHLEDRRIHLQRAALSAPVLGLQGSGHVDLDGRLDLMVVAAPLADWKKKLQKTRLPLLGDIGAELAGGIQTLLNTATGKVLYHFKVSGTAQDPALTPEPLPILREDAVKLFAHMIKATKADRLLEQLKK